MNETQRLHLGYDKDGKVVGANYSGRLVKMRILKPADARHIKDEVYRAVTPETTNVQVDESISDLGIEQAIVSYTEPTTPDKAATAKWIETNGAKLHEDKGSIFTIKDLDLLKQVYLRLHHVNGKEIDDIMGGAVGVVD